MANSWRAYTLASLPAIVPGKERYTDVAAMLMWVGAGADGPMALDSPLMPTVNPDGPIPQGERDIAANGLITAGT